LQKNANAGQGLGLTATLVNPQPAQYSHNFFMAAVCNKCCHLQLFRPDLVKGRHTFGYANRNSFASGALKKSRARTKYFYKVVLLTEF
jgi:hypothetical protein